jgi:site-specific recombinase XerD
MLPAIVDAGELADPSRLTAAAALAAALDAAREFAAGSKSDATRKAYASDWRSFTAWCSSVDRSPLPAEPAVLAAYLAHLAELGRKPATIRRRLAAIQFAHRARGLSSPTADINVEAVHAGIRRRLGTAPVQKSPATAKAIAAMLKALDRTQKNKSGHSERNLNTLRDRALLLIGFAGAFRRSELVGITVEDVDRRPEGLMIRLGATKTDQEGRGAHVPIPNGSRLRPVEALDAWLEAAGIRSGPLFRAIGKGGRLSLEPLTPQSVALIVKRAAKAAKLDASTFAGHSLRSGFVTSALETGADVLAAADQGRWRKLETVREYDRRAKAFRNHAGKGFL